VTAVLEVLPVAVGLALAALPIVLIPLALATNRPPGVVRAFLAGWLVGVLGAGALVIALADVIVRPEEHPLWLSYVKLVLGIALLGLAVRKWLARAPAGEEPEPAKWMASVTTMNAGKAFRIALLLACVNPKNLLLVVSGATVIADATYQPLEQAVALLVFAVVGSIGVATPVVLPLVLGARAETVLATTNRWMTRYSSVIVAVVLLVLGVLLVLDGIRGL
jgi:threonine/homoserine/homoserine lactone efflux protein